MSRYCNKDIKVISTKAILVTLCQLWKWFRMVRKLWKPPSRKTYQNLRKLQGKYLKRIFVIVKPFFVWFAVILLMIQKLMILWRFIWKLHVQSFIVQLQWIFFLENLLTYHSSNKILRNFSPLWLHKGSLGSLCLPLSWFTRNKKATVWNLELTPLLVSLSNTRDGNIKNSSTR